MINLIHLLILIVITLLPVQSFGDIGPEFDVQMLYKEAPVICKVTVQEVKSTLIPVKHEKRFFKGSVATLKVHRYYKGEGPDEIKVKFPSGKDVTGSRLAVYGWGFRTVENGQHLIVFLKKGLGDYRFFYDVYDTYMPISKNSNSDAKGFQAIREDIVSSIDDEWKISGSSIEQVKSHGWTEALSRLKVINTSNNLSDSRIISD